MKKVLSLLLAVIMTVSCLALAFSASAAEAGTLPSNAIVLTEGEYYTKYWTYNNYFRNCYNKITVPERGYITLTLEKPYDARGEIGNFELLLVDENGKDVWRSETYAQRNTFSEHYVYKIGLNKGTYYLNIDPNFYIRSNSAPIPASYKYNFTESNYWEIEPNNTQTTATTLKFDKMYSGVYKEESYGSTYVDYYKVSLKKGKNYVIKIENYEELDSGRFNLYLVDTSGKEGYLFEESIKGRTAFFKITATTTGTYYIKFDNDGNDAGVEYKVGISQNITPISSKTAKLSATSYVYDGKEKKPKVIIAGLKNGTDYTVSYSNNKAIGKATVTITGKGNYNGKKTLYFNILPSKTSKLSVSQTTTSIKATWKAVTGATGYKVTLYTSKGKAVKTVYTTKTTYTFSKLSKGTTYKVRVTAYKTIDGKKVASIVYKQLTTATKPAAPKIKSADGYSWCVTLEWKEVSGATGYDVYMAKSKDGSYKKVDSTVLTTYDEYDVTEGKTYYFKVRAYIEVNDKKIYSDFSPIKSIKAI